MAQIVRISANISHWKRAYNSGSRIPTRSLKLHVKRLTSKSFHLSDIISVGAICTLQMFGSAPIGEGRTKWVEGRRCGHERLCANKPNVKKRTTTQPIEIIPPSP
jgi:hypothetical protein